MVLSQISLDLTYQSIVNFNYVDNYLLQFMSICWYEKIFHQIPLKIKKPRWRGLCN